MILKAFKRLASPEFNFGKINIFEALVCMCISNNESYILNKVLKKLKIA